MLSSKYFKSNQAFYDELAINIRANDSHRVLATLLKMGLAGTNIHKVVSGDDVAANDVKGTPLYRIAIGSDITILQHLQEFGVIIPADILVPEPETKRPAALKTTSMFAQHYMFRRTRQGKTILQNQPACGGFCYEYARFHMVPKNATNDFMDKLLRQLYKHSENFYRRIYGYQNATEFRLSHERINIDIIRNKNEGILETYGEKLKEAEFVMVDMSFLHCAHAVVIRKLTTSEGIKYQLFDPTAFDGKLLTHDQLNERFNEHIKLYETEWNWGKLHEITMGDLGKHLLTMGHLKNINNKFPLKNLHAFVKALETKDIDTLKSFIQQADFSADNTTQYSVQGQIVNYLRERDNDLRLKLSLISILSDDQLAKTVESIIARSNELTGYLPVLVPFIKTNIKDRISKELLQRFDDTIDKIRREFPKLGI